MGVARTFCRGIATNRSDVSPTVGYGGIAMEANNFYLIIWTELSNFEVLEIL